MNQIEYTAELLSKFPSIGKKTAVRLVYYLLKQSPEFSIKLGQSLVELHEHIVQCNMCGTFTDQESCEICNNPQRDNHTICVVSQPQDVFALESSQSYQGLYHVLGGLISPLDGIGPDKLSIDKLKSRIEEENVTEIILATNPSIEGESTARYIAKVCNNGVCKFTRIAQGMPMGGDFEYTDKHTLALSLNSRTSLL